MVKLLFILFLILVSLNTLAEIEEAESISFGPVQVGENRVPIGHKDIELVKDVKEFKVRAELIKNSFQWVRYNGILLIPRARIRIIVDTNDKNIHLKYKNQTILPQYSSKKLYFSEFYISLFQPDDIKLYHNKEIVGKISIKTKSAKHDNPKKNHMIDYSCAPYDVRIEGLDNEYASVGCILHRVGRFRKEKGMLEVHFTSANFVLDNGKLPPYVATMINSRPVKFELVNREGVRKTVKIYARVPKRMKRLKTALGFGPYFYETNHSSTLKKDGWAPTGMIYAKFDLTKNSSLRLFDALVWKDGYFNNFGVYFAYDLASAMDNRFLVVPLLGFQGLTTKYSKHTDSYHKIIYPQGFELVYKHPFGKKNYSFVFGLFTNASVADDDYNNIWIRYGKRVFWELNYISWQRNERKASMWGLSVGIPFLSFF